MFETPFTSIISGPSGCGKTTLLKNILCKLISNSLEGVDIHFFYKNWQPLYDFLSLKMKRVKFYIYWIDGKKSNLYEKSEIETLASKSKPGSFFIFDDALEALKSKAIEDFFTRISHHQNCNVFLLVQNLFDPLLRVISRNSSYMILFRSPRDASQIRHIAFQMFLEKKKAEAFMKTFNDVTSEPFGYIMIDFRPHTSDNWRIATDILSLIPTHFSFSPPLEDL